MYYEIVGGNEDKMFAISNFTGDLYLVRPLDYEKKNKHDLRVAVSDGRYENDATIIVHVLDVNDNPPVFDRHLYETRIVEEDDDDLPKRILKVTVTDGDYDRPSNVVFSLSGQGIDIENPANSQFQIIPTTGEIFVNKPIDRDYPRGRPNWVLTVFAQDEGGTGLVSYSEVVVKVKDINDNPPVFPEVLYYGNATENGPQGQEVMTLKAEDYDDPREGSNAQMTYTLKEVPIERKTDKPMFIIESGTGIIRTNICCLDREETQGYLVQVVATDGGGFTGTGTASILVLDVNDTPPKFSKEEWVVETDETGELTVPIGPILTVSASDMDEINDFSYRIIVSSGFGSDKFAMKTNRDGTGSLMIAKPLDFEDPTQVYGFKFQIGVSDTGEEGFHDSRHTAKAWVRVRLKDINDNEPQFINPISEVRAFENTPVGKTLVILSASDLDNSGHSKVVYSIERSSNKNKHFRIDGAGSVIVQRTLDRETDPYHLLQVMATDDGIPARTGTTTLTVIVMDINDNAPQILEYYYPVLHENRPPGEFAEILAVDFDDPLKGNGPPFEFKLSPLAPDEIKSSFKVVNSPSEANGEGVAKIVSHRTFDREVQKEYHVPIVVKDSGVPPMSGTSTLTVLIGDENDNNMESGKKDILFYNYKGRALDTQIGRVYVCDPDDWDTADKRFTWATNPHPNFQLDEDTGMITMKQAASETSYNLQFIVHDTKYQSRAEGAVTVKVRHVSETAVKNSGSVRIEAISSEDFISQWDYRTKTAKKSIADKFKEKLAKIFEVNSYNIDLFSIMSRLVKPQVTDIFFSIFDSWYLSSFKVNGLLLFHKDEIERELGLSIVLVGIDECLYENLHCDGSCTSKIEVVQPQYLIDANRTSFTGVQIKVIPECVCGTNLPVKNSCQPNPCFNNGRCLQKGSNVDCLCPEGYDGPRCQSLVRNFLGNGFAWFPPLRTCETPHLSVEFMSTQNEGLLLYNGPLTFHWDRPYPWTDLISLELINGRLQFLVDFGSGMLQLQVNGTEPLTDGSWHRVDVFWDREIAWIVVDQCKNAKIYEIGDRAEKFVDLSTCQARGKLPPFSELLNVNSPLQVGGLARPLYHHSLKLGQSLIMGKPFRGCIRNLRMNSHLYDLSRPSLHKNSEMGCLRFDRLCNRNATIVGCGPHGQCDGSIHEPFCHCNPGWKGPYCNEPTVPAYFKAESFAKYGLSFTINPFKIHIQLRFRTWERNGELFRLSNEINNLYVIVEIKESYLQFRYNLNSIKPDEHYLCLPALAVNNGEWHVAQIERFGPTVVLSLDGGEGHRYNESSSTSRLLPMDVDELNGIYMGGKADYTSANIFTVQNDYKYGCIDDLRLDGRILPLPPGLTGNQWAQTTVFNNIVTQCASHNQCLNVTCIAPLTCKELWKKHECGCPDGTQLSKDHRVCLDKDECLSSPCKNGGTCRNQHSSYKCYCPGGYIGINCERIADADKTQWNLPAYAAIIVCIIIVLALVILCLFCLRRKRPRLPKNERNAVQFEADLRADGQGRAGEVTTLDLTALNFHAVSTLSNGGSLNSKDTSISSGIENVDVIVCNPERPRSFSQEAPPPDWNDVPTFAIERGDTPQRGTLQRTKF
ncbi:neural-cadherin-like isoform X2 [Macrobrachium rosenbergii]|uniref:neural-cadherin-like isoform X2 n=1 Tax=Macrobrachium rosenbergii TaxID=79674 RepID=UPI0034D3C8CB